MSLMLIMLVMQFNSFYQALLILFSVVMSTPVYCLDCYYPSRYSALFSPVSALWRWPVLW